MRFNELIEILKDEFRITPLLSSSPPTIEDIRLIDNLQENWDENTLYIGNIKDAKNPPNKPIMLITFEKTELPQNSNIAITDSKNFYSIFNKSKDLIFEDLKIGNLLFELSEMALNGKSLSYIINTAALRLGNALILIDSNQKVLGYSTNFEIVDPLWLENINRGYCSYEFISKVKADKSMIEWNKRGNDTQFIKLPGDKQQKLVARITQSGHLVGALIMIEHHSSIQHYHVKQLPIVGRILFDVFSRDSAFGGPHGSIYSSILYKLLDESETHDNIENINLSKLKFPDEMKVIVARFNSYIENRYVKRTLSIELERIFPKGYSVIYKGYIGILVSSISDEQYKKLIDLVEKEDISIGISWPFNDIKDFKRYFYQAVAAIKQANCFGLN